MTFVYKPYFHVNKTCANLFSNQRMVSELEQLTSTFQRLADNRDTIQTALDAAQVRTAPVSNVLSTLILIVFFPDRTRFLSMKLKYRF